MANSNTESFQESYDKLSPAEKARYILSEQCSVILYDPATSYIVDSEETGRFLVYEEDSPWPRVDVHFGGANNYQVSVREILGPAHSNAGWSVLRVEKID